MIIMIMVVVEDDNADDEVDDHDDEVDDHDDVEVEDGI